MNLRPSNVIGKLTKLIEIGSHINTLTDIFGAFCGIPPSEKAHAAVKGIYGLFGQGDERKLAVLLDDLEKRRPHAREVLSGFFSYHAPKGTLIRAGVSWFYGNQFRTFIGKMGSSEGRVEGKKTHTTTWDTNGKAHKEEVVTDLRRAGDDNALDFLEMMVQTIDPEGRVSPDPHNPPQNAKRPTKTYLERGYERLLKQFISFGYPHIPPDLAEKMETAIKAVTTAGAAGYAAALANITAAADATEAYATRLKQKQGWFTRLLQKI
jgi:hypothetical protein